MPTAWNDGKDFGAHPKHDILVFAVANTCGLDTYLDERQLREGLQEMIFKTEWPLTLLYLRPDTPQINVYTHRVALRLPT